MSGKNDRVTTTVGNGFSGRKRVFRDNPLPRGETSRVMNERVFDRAVERANRKLRETDKTSQAHVTADT